MPLWFNASFQPTHRSRHGVPHESIVARRTSNCRTAPTCTRSVALASHAAPNAIAPTGKLDNRLNCVGVPFDRSALGLASRRPWRCDVRRIFSTEEAGRTSRATEQNSLRFARSAFNPYSVASTSSPSSSVLKFFLNCGRHMFPPLSEAAADSSDCPSRHVRFALPRCVAALESGKPSQPGDDTCSPLNPPAQSSARRSMAST